MAHWFHRNPLKASSPMKFDAALPSESKPPKDAVELTKNLKTVRLKLLELLANHSSDMGDVSVAFTEYLSLLKGFIEAPVESGGESRLRSCIHYRWTNSLGGRTPSVQADAQYELFSIIMNVAIWHSKHGAQLAATDEINLETAKEVHRCLKMAAGYMLFCKEHVLTKLPPTTEKCVDHDPRIVDAYANQFQAEAQEVTLARALELKHKPSVIYSLAVETSKIFTVAGDALSTLDEVIVGKWMSYLRLKAMFYNSYAYCFFGQDLLAQEKCGESIKVLQHSSTMYSNVEKLCVKYSRTKGPGTIARPERHPFFQKLGPLVKMSLDKSTRENGFIFYQKVPEQLPDIPSGVVYGLATPEDLTPPPHNPLWTEEVYTALIDKKPEYPAAGTQEIAPIPEPDVAPGQNPAPKTESSCIIA